MFLSQCLLHCLGVLSHTVQMRIVYQYWAFLQLDYHWQNRAAVSKGEVLQESNWEPEGFRTSKLGNSVAKQNLYAKDLELISSSLLSMTHEIANHFQNLSSGKINSQILNFIETVYQAWGMCSLPDDARFQILLHPNRQLVRHNMNYQCISDWSPAP